MIFLFLNTRPQKTDSDKVIARKFKLFMFLISRDFSSYDILIANCIGNVVFVALLSQQMFLFLWPFVCNFLAQYKKIEPQQENKTEN